MASINVLLAGDHPIIRSSLRGLLEHEHDFRIVAEAASAREAVVLADYKRPDVLLLDFHFPHLNGIAATREILAANPAARIIFIAEHMEEGYVSQAFNLGARGYVAEATADIDLIRAVHVVSGGGYFISPSITRQLIEQCDRDHSRSAHLDDASRELCCLLAGGYNEAEIAMLLNRDSNRTELDYNALDHLLEQLSLPNAITTSVKQNRVSCR